MKMELPIQWELPKGKKSMVFRTCWKCNGHAGGIVDQCSGGLLACSECKGLGGWPVSVEKATDVEREALEIVGR